MLHIHLIAFGRSMAPWVRAGYEEYARRIHGRCALTLTEVAPAPRPPRPDRARIARLETTRIRRAILPGSRVIALERGGRRCSTADITARMEGWMRDGERVAMLVGAADGLPPEVVADAHETWSLSPLTFSHPVVRVLVAEQIYRCYATLEGLPYPR